MAHSLKPYLIASAQKKRTKGIATISVDNIVTGIAQLIILFE